MYDELVKRLRTATTLPVMNALCQEAADAIEELTGFVQEAERDRDEYRERLDKANDAIEELSAIREEQKAEIILMAAEDKPRWIPVTERLPVGGDDSGAVCENVCLMMDDGTVSCGWMNGITKKVYYLNARDDVIIKAPITRVTHWMPLPEPPKEE